MQSLKIIRHRIKSVKNMRKVTKAMKFVAAAKLKSAQKEAISARNYTHNLWEIIKRISKKAGANAPPLMRRRSTINNIDCLLITSSRGLCGSFNENLIRAVIEKVQEHKTVGIGVNLFVVGKKGWQLLKSKDFNVYKIDFGYRDIYDFAKSATDLLVTRFLSGESDGAFIAFNHFISASRQEVTFWDHVPLHWRGIGLEKHIDYMYEPNKDDVMDELTRELLCRLIMQAILESNASEQAARMLAMDKATKNADDMIASLTLQYNKARQATVTSELLDIIGGAEAIR